MNNYIQLKAYRMGDFIAKERLIKNNLSLVTIVASNFDVSADMKDDIYQIGCIGLIKAIDSFDIDSSEDFRDYAIRCIHSEIDKQISKQGLYDYDSLEEIKENETEYSDNLVNDIYGIDSKSLSKEIDSVLTQVNPKYVRIFKDYYSKSHPDTFSLALKYGVTPDVVNYIVRYTLEEVRAHLGNKKTK